MWPQTGTQRREWKGPREGRRAWTWKDALFFAPATDAHAPLCVRLSVQGRGQNAGHLAEARSVLAALLVIRDEARTFRLGLA